VKILGISAFYHDSAACLVEDGRIVAAAQEERFTRVKHDAAFPLRAIRYCLDAERITGAGLDAVAFYEKPILKFHRILETALAVAPRGLETFLRAVPLWLRDRLWAEPTILDGLRACGIEPPEHVYYPEHHTSHAASAFYPSPFEEAAIVTLDGVGEWATSTIGVGEGNSLQILQQQDFPHSLGLLYSAFTYQAGFRVNSGEYKLMGLAPYGEPRYTRTILDTLLDLKPDGSFRLNMDYFGYLDAFKMTNARFDALFDGPPRDPEAEITKRDRDLAASIQQVTEEIVLRIARHAREITGKSQLCLAGGVALNCVANGKLLRAGIFDDLWIQPAAGDAGGAIGAALSTWHDAMNGARELVPGQDAMQGALLGPAFDDDEIASWLDAKGYPYTRLSDDVWPDEIARLLADEKVVGVVQGRMEFGPRALGGRSILGDARSPKMQSVMNLKIKFRESFRPFAPSVLEERVSDFFDLDRPSPYMLLVAEVRRARWTAETYPETTDEQRLDLTTWVNRARSDIPAVTHVDHSARVQTVSAAHNPRYHALLAAFERLTGFGVLINTSFNVRGEPIVCTPEDGYRCFVRTEMDYLALGNCLLERRAQPRWQDRDNWRETFKAD